MERLGAECWPRFLLHGDVRDWNLLFDLHPGFQFALVDASSGEALAAGHTVPIAWDGNFGDLPRTIQEAIERGAGEDGGANALVALAALVAPPHRGRGLSREIVIRMTALARTAGLSDLVAPVRPVWKDRHPLLPMEEYVRRRNPDGGAFDPWIRVHERLGAEPVGVTPCTLTVEGTVREWEDWTGLDFERSGSYLVPGALQPVSVDVERDQGRYEDPNYWMRHRISIAGDTSAGGGQAPAVRPERESRSADGGGR